MDHTQIIEYNLSSKSPRVSKGFIYKNLYEKSFYIHYIEQSWVYAPLFNNHFMSDMGLHTNIDTIPVLYNHFRQS